MPTHTGHWKYRCEPAARIVRALGGTRAAARRLGVSAERCSQWNRPAARGGTGGWIPPEHWSRLERIAAEMSLPWLDRKLLMSGRKERPDVGAMSRRKGAMFEREVASDLRAAGLDARKVPLSGADKNYPGDVAIESSPTGKWILQCKISTEGGGRNGVLAMLRECVIGRVSIMGKDELVAMRRPQFVGLVRGVAPKPVNWPGIRIPGRQILEHLEGHDALVFRRTGQREWMAVVRRDKFDAI
jgi:hypothetical protein